MKNFKILLLGYEYIHIKLKNVASQIIVGMNKVDSSLLYVIKTIFCTAEEPN